MTKCVNCVFYYLFLSVKIMELLRIFNLYNKAANALLVTIHIMQKLKIQLLKMFSLFYFEKFPINFVAISTFIFLQEPKKKQITFPPFPYILQVWHHQQHVHLKLYRQTQIKCLSLRASLLQSVCLSSNRNSSYFRVFHVILFNFEGIRHIHQRNKLGKTFSIMR